MGDWQKVFANTADGHASFGSIAALAAAVGAGRDVKVEYTLFDGSATMSWVRTLPSVTVTQDTGLGGVHEATVVSGIVTDVPDTDVAIGLLDLGETEGGTGGRTFEDDPFAVEWHIYNSSGRRQVVKFDRATHQVISNQTSNLAMTWYARS